MTVLGCKWHPSADNVGVCAHCLRESLSRLAVYQDEEDDSIDLEIFPPSMPPTGMPAGNRRGQFILVQYDEEGNNNRGEGVDHSDLFYPGVHRNAMGALQPQQPEDHEPTDLNMDGPDMQGEVSTSEDSGSGGQDEGAAHHRAPPRVEDSSNRNKRKLQSSSSRRKPKSWGSAMMKMVGFRTLSVLWRSEKKNATEGSSSRTKLEDSGVPAHFTPARFSVSSALEQTTPLRFSVSSQWEQTTPTRYNNNNNNNNNNNDQVTPARYSGASLFDIESMDSRRFSTSSRGSPFTRPVINGENFNAAWRASKSGTHGRFEGKVSHSGIRGYGDENGAAKSPMKSPAKSPMKSPWKWFASFKSVATTPKETSTKDGLSTRQRERLPAAPISPYQERRKSTSSMPVNKVRETTRAQQPLTPVLTSKKPSPWWKTSPIPRTPKKSPLMPPMKARDQEMATDSQDDTPHRLSSASPMVGYSRSSSNGSSCFTTPRWNNRTSRAQHGNSRGMAAHDREHEITHLAI